MTYRELLALYKTGELPEEQRESIARDIEKQDAISEYLYENDTLELPEAPPEEAVSDSDRALTDQIRRTIRRTLTRMGVIIAAVVLILVLAAIFLLPHVVSLFYYDPTEIIAEEEGVLFPTDRMSLDLAVYSELYLPGFYRDQVIAEPEGWGTYSLVIPQTASPDGRMVAVGGRLKRGELLLYDPNALKTPGDNLFLPPEGVDPMFHFIDGTTGDFLMPQGSWEEAYEDIDALSDHEFYVGYISLNELMDYADLYRWFEEKKMKTASAWCSVYAEDENGEALLNNTGFQFKFCGTTLTWDKETYPRLSVLDADGWADFSDEVQMRTHFISMLRYVRDFPELPKMLAGQRADHFPDFPRRAEAALERDGLRTYGFSVTARKDIFLDLRDDPLVSYIHVDPLR